MPWGVLGVLGYPWRTPRDVLGAAMGVPGGLSARLREVLRVPWRHVGFACGVLAVLKIDEKPSVSVVFPPTKDPWATLGRHASVSGFFFGLVGCFLRSLGAPWRQLGSPWDQHGPLWEHLGGPSAITNIVGCTWKVPRSQRAPRHRDFGEVVTASGYR